MISQKASSAFAPSRLKYARQPLCDSVLNESDGAELYSIRIIPARSDSPSPREVHQGTASSGAWVPMPLGRGLRSPPELQ